MRKLFLLIYFLILNCTILYSQPQLEWIKTYPKQGLDAIIDSSGNIVIACRNHTNDTTFKLIKYRNDGQIIWQKTYYVFISPVLATDKYCNIYLTRGGTNGYTTIKIDSSGNQIWIRYYHTGIIDNSLTLALDTSGNVFVTGYSWWQAYNYLTIKYNSNGDSLWTARYVGTDPNAASIPSSICTDIQGNVYITGTGNTIEYATIKYNKDGIQQWVAAYRGPNNYGTGGYGPYTIKVDNLGYVYVTGGIYLGNNLEAFGTLKYLPNGDTVWTRIYFSGPSQVHSDYGVDIALDNDDNVNVLGVGNDRTTSPVQSFTTIKYNKYGNIKWVINDSIGYTPTKIALIKDKIFATGTTGNRIYSDGCDTTGQSIFSSKYPSFLYPYINYSGLNIFSDKFNGFYIFGSSLDTLVLIKYSLTTSINNITNNIPIQYKLFQNYPNPFNPTTKIKFDIPALSSPLTKGGLRGVVTLKIYNILGKEIETLVNEKLNPGTYEVTFNASQYPSGVYFYRLVSDNYTETKRMILLK